MPGGSDYGARLYEGVPVNGPALRAFHSVVRPTVQCCGTPEAAEPQAPGTRGLRPRRPSMNNARCRRSHRRHSRDLRPSAENRLGQGQVVLVVDVDHLARPRLDAAPIGTEERMGIAHEKSGATDGHG